MPPKNQTFIFLALYAALRVFSYWFQPNTPPNTFAAALVLFTAVYFLLRRDERGWYIVASELILGGTGNFLSVADISLRTWLLISSLTIFFAQKIVSAKNFGIFTKNKFIFFLIPLYAILAFSALRGYYLGHSLNLIKTEIVPYLFFLYYFPLKELLQNNKYLISPPASQARALRAGNIQYLIFAAIVGNLLFVAFTFIGFSSHLFILQDNYYHWFRDIANGKITDLGFNFYRIVLNEQLLLVPLLLWLLTVSPSPSVPLPRERVSLLGALSSRRGARGEVTFALAAVLLFTLSINLTRIYILALGVGLLFLFTKANWKRWLLTSLSVLFLFFASFTVIHLAASRGQSLGWEIFGLRLQSIASPNLEESSLSRMLLLPKILDKIKIHPLLGNGLGDTVTVYSPVLNQQITTSQFDWGYLQIWDELGLAGLSAWLMFIVCLFYLFKQKKSPRWLAASLASLLIINITSPALFHVLGVVWLVSLLSFKADVFLELHSSPLRIPAPTGSSTATDK